MNPTLAAIALLSQLISAATSAMGAAQQVSDLIKKVKLENRDVTLDELKQLFLLDNTARDLLETEINKIESENTAKITKTPLGG